MDQIGKLVILAGLGLVLVGSLLLALAKIPGLKLGELPRDFAFSIGRGWVVSFPLATMLVVSALLSLILLVIGLVRR